MPKLYHIIVPYHGTVLVKVEASSPKEALDLLPNHDGFIEDNTEFDLDEAEIDEVEDIAEEPTP